MDLYIFLFGASNVTQVLKELTIKSNDLSLIPETHMVGESQLPRVALRPPHACSALPTCAHTCSKYFLLSVFQVINSHHTVSYL